MNSTAENLHIYVNDKAREARAVMITPRLEVSAVESPAVAFGLRAIFDRSADQGRKIIAVRFETLMDGRAMLEIMAERSADFATMEEFVSHLGFAIDVHNVFATDCSEAYAQAWQAFLTGESIIPPICRTADFRSAFVLSIAKKGGVEPTLALVQEILPDENAEAQEAAFAHAFWMRGRGEQLVADRASQPNNKENNGC